MLFKMILLAFRSIKGDLEFPSAMEALARVLWASCERETGRASPLEGGGIFETYRGFGLPRQGGIFET